MWGAVTVRPKRDRETTLAEGVSRRHDRHPVNGGGDTLRHGAVAGDRDRDHNVRDLHVPTRRIRWAEVPLIWLRVEREWNEGVSEWSDALATQPQLTLPVEQLWGAAMARGKRSRHRSNSAAHEPVSRSRG